MSYAPVVFISVLTGQRVDNVIKMAKYVAENRAMRVPTGRLNNLISDAIMMKQPPSDKGRRLKIYYVTQVGVKPPLFSFKVNSRLSCISRMRDTWRTRSERHSGSKGLR